VGAPYGNSRAIENPCGSQNRHLTLLSIRGGDLLYVYALLRRIKFRFQYNMRSRKVADGFRVFDYPDCLIVVGYENGPLRFPFRVANRRTATPAFLDAVGMPGLGMLGSATLIADPTGTRCGLLLRPYRCERDDTNEQAHKSKPTPAHSFSSLRPTDRSQLRRRFLK
jgi:hypothetical protein